MKRKVIVALIFTSLLLTGCNSKGEISSGEQENSISSEYSFEEATSDAQTETSDIAPDEIPSPFVIEELPREGSNDTTELFTTLTYVDPRHIVNEWLPIVEELDYTTVYLYTVPEGVEVIASDAFRDFKNYDMEYRSFTMELPSTLKYIEKRAFKRRKVEYLEIPASVISIGDYAFEYAEMRRIKFNEGLQTIGIGAFEQADLDEIILPDSLTKLGDNAFAENFDAKHLHIGSGLKTIPKRAFSSMHNYEGELVIPDKVVKVEDGAFSGGGYTSVVIPNSVTLCDSAFVFSDNVTELHIPESVKKLDIAGFFGMDSLKDVYISDNTYIYDDRTGRDCYSVDDDRFKGMTTVFHYRGKDYTLQQMKEICMASEEALKS